MSSIPPNILGSIVQAQIAAKETARDQDAKRNKRVSDSRELARLADQQTHEVENTDQAEQLRVHKEGDQDRESQHEPLDSYEHTPSEKSQEETLEQEIPAPKNITPSDSDDEPPHIDLSV